MVVQRLQAAALVVGPLVFAASPFFWVDGHYGVNGGMLIALSMVPWVYGLIGEYERLREHVPTAAGLWLLLLLIGMFGTIGFGMQGFFEGAFGIGMDDRAALGRLGEYPPQSIVMLWLPGPTFPLSLLVFGVLLVRTRMAPRWVAVMICLAAIAFPVGRVLRLEWVAYVADFLVVVPFSQLAWRAWHRRESVATTV